MIDEHQEDGADGAGASNGASGAAGGKAAPNSIEALTAERDEMKDRMLRIAAEFENWKRRARKEQDDAESKAREGVLRDMLDVIDNLERAVGAFEGNPAAGKAAPAPDGGAVLKGVNLVLRLFQSKLERYNVKPIAARGEPFDPKIHEAISRVETAEVPPGAVAVELQRGYRIGERLLRPAMVSVASAPAKPPEGGGA